jgi:diguanylate cyclase (GGDEF)-like protein
MRKDDVVITFNMSKKDFEAFSLKTKGATLIQDPKKLKGLEPSLIIIGVGNKTPELKKLLKKLDQYFLDCLKYIYFTNKRFDDLSLLVGRSDIRFLTHPFKPKDLRSMFDTFLERGKKANNLVDFISRSIKFKTISDLSEHVIHYLKGISTVTKVDCYMTESQVIKECPVCHKDNKLKVALEEFDPRNKVVGTYRLMGSGTNKYVLIPIYKLDELLVIVRVDYSGDPKEILNRYFFSYLKNVYFYQSNKNKATSFKNLSMIDEVTGLFNQRKLTRDIEEAVEEHRQLNKSFSIMFIDVDFFKEVNDSWGHVVGSEMLIQIGEELKRVLRGGDRIYRYGGDEFVVLLAGVESKMLYTIANRVLDAVKGHKFDVPDGEHKLSVSIGLGEYPKDAKSAKEILQFADEMMYLSKKSGRGTVFHVNEVKEHAPADS